MIPVSLKHLAPVLIGLCFVATVAWAQTREQLQEQLVDTNNRAEQEVSRASEKLNVDDIPGGCADLRAAAADTAASLELTRQLSGLIGQDTALHEDTRGRMLEDLQAMSARLASQKPNLETQITAKCN